MPVFACTQGSKKKNFNCKKFISIDENCTSGEAFNGNLANDSRNTFEAATKQTKRWLWDLQRRTRRIIL
jgi:hypothetical protein